MKLFKKDFYNEFISENQQINSVPDITTITGIIKLTKQIVQKQHNLEYQIIKYKRKNYYLIEDKVYIINKDKSLGELFGDYIDEKIIELLQVKIEYQIIKHKRKNYYLIKDKVYIINKNKSLGELFGDYIDKKVIEIKINK